jgi:beta-lactam-binding protein with PASTA domain/Tol biopolymer transport system component
MDMPVIRTGEPLPPGVQAGPSLLTPEAVQITLTYPELPGNVQKLVVEAGGHANMPALVRNQSGIVDNYEVQIRGMPEEWCNVAPPSVYLVPFGAPSGTYEQEVTLHFNPPRSAEAEAKVWELEIVAVSRAQGEVAGSTKASVEITPYEQLESELRPEIVTGRRRGEYALMVRNRANAPIDTMVTAVDSANALTFEFAKQRFVADPGRRDGTTFTVRARKHHWVGRSMDRRFEISAHGVAGIDAASTRPITGTFRQKPWIPYWVPIVVPAIIAAAALLYTLIPHKTTVPNLHGLTADAANIALKKANLKPPTQVTQVPSKTVAYLHIVRQNPSYHIGPVKQGNYKQNKVKTGTSVTYWLAEPRVPNLVGATPDQAQKVLPNQKLVLGKAKTALARGKTKIGTIISQSPPARTPVAEGTTITVVVAVGSGLRTVPNVVGQGIGQASAVIKGAGLTPVLNPLPPNVDPTTAKISLQVPSALTREKAGSAVTIYVNPPPPPTTTTTPKNKTTPTNTGPTVSSNGLTGAAAAAAASQVSAAGGTPVMTKQFSTEKPGTVIGTNPADISSVQKGQTVQLFVSAGYPDIVFSDGRHILVMNGGTGKVSGVIAKSSDVEDEPTWQPSGTLIAYRRGADQTHGAIWMVDMSKGATTAHQMTAGPDDRRPAFSPDGKVIAFIRRSTSTSGTTDGDLCFVRTASTLRQGACIKDPAFNVDRPAWSPDGRAILVVATDPKDANQTELGEYTSAKPFSSSPSDWQWQGLITDKMHGTKSGEGVLFAAFSPDGTQVAIVANWAATNLSLFKIFTAGWSNGQMANPKAVTPAIRACEVAWRSDSGELAVTAADNCSSGQGALVRVKLSDPGTVTTLRAAGSQNPSWQFVQLQ